MICKADIENIFGELLSKISNSELREKTVDAWVEAAKLGSWETVDELKKVPFTRLVDCKGINILEHTIAVTFGAIGLAESQLKAYTNKPYAINMDRVVVGGLLHDIGKLMEIEKDGQGGFRKSLNGKCTRHPISGAILADRLGFSDDIVNVIGCHAKEGEGRPQVVETVLVHQADFATFNPLVMMGKDNLITEI